MARLPNLLQQKRARAQLDELAALSKHAWAVHYCCGSIAGTDQVESPSVSVIAVQNLSTGERKLFSLHHIAELAKLSQEDRISRRLEIEQVLLENFFEFAQSHHENTFVHWNMDGTTYGFQALEHRYRCLIRSEPFQVKPTNKLNLAATIIEIYGAKYLPPPHFFSIAQRNNLSIQGLMKGHDEPLALERGEYQNLARSCERKATLICEFFALVQSGEFESDSNWWILDKWGARSFAENVDGNLPMAIPLFFGASFFVGSGFDISPSDLWDFMLSVFTKR